MEDGNFRPPTEYTPLNRSPKNLAKVITPAAPKDVPNLVQIRPQGISGRKITFLKFIYLYLFQELTYRSDPSTDFHA